MKILKLVSIILLINGSLYSQTQMNVPADRKAKAYASDTVVINAPVEKVYSLLTDISKWPQWFEGVTETTISGAPEEGKNFRFKAKGYKIKSQIHTLRINSGIGWTGNMWWIKAVHNWYFEPLSDGRTRVINVESFSGLGSSMLNKKLWGDLHNDLLFLKKAAEK